MEVLPAINCESYKCIRQKLEVVDDLSAGGVHIDVSDGNFGSVVTWNKPETLFRDFDFSDLLAEAHFMVTEPQRFLDRWIGAGLDRAIVHVESDFVFEEVRQFCDRRRAELFVALSPGTPEEEIHPYLNRVDGIQCLAVDPGPSGQRFEYHILDRIESLRSKSPNVKIEVDGGINGENSSKIREAGADILVSGSYIFDSGDPKEAFEKLKGVQ